MGKPDMKFLRRLYPKRDFSEPSAAILADVLLLAVAVAGGLLFFALD